VPTETFFNLPEEKRRRIIDVAVREFGRNTYHRASLSRIVAEAGIAKGSMYQYFRDKFDLYAYLLEMAGKVKLEAIDKAMAELDAGASLEERLMAATRAGLSLAHSHPELYSLGMNLLRETDQTIVARVLERLQPMSDNIFADWFRESMAAGHIDPAINPTTALYMLSAVSMRVGQDLADGRLTLDQAVPLLRQMLVIMTKGMRPAGTPSAAGTGGGKRVEEKGSDQR